MKAIKQFFQDEKGQYSSARFALILTMFFFFCQWIYELIKKGSFAPSWELISLFCFVVLGKTLQKFAE